LLLSEKGQDEEVSLKGGIITRDTENKKAGWFPACFFCQLMHHPVVLSPSKDCIALFKLLSD
jgi:hypothetical protein